MKSENFQTCIYLLRATKMTQFFIADIYLFANQLKRIGYIYSILKRLKLFKTVLFFLKNILRFWYCLFSP